MEMKVEQRRSSTEIIADILRLGEASKTEMMYGANLSFFQLKRYLNLLLRLELIDKVTEGNLVAKYRVTQKGIRLLRNIDNIGSILETLKTTENDQS